MNRCTFNRNKKAHNGLQNTFASSKIEWHEFNFYKETITNSKRQNLDLSTEVTR